MLHLKIVYDMLYGDHHAAIATNLFLYSGDIFPNKLQWTMSSLQNNQIILVMHVVLSYTPPDWALQ